MLARARKLLTDYARSLAPILDSFIRYFLLTLQEWSLSRSGDSVFLLSYNAVSGFSYKGWVSSDPRFYGKYNNRDSTGSYSLREYIEALLSIVIKKNSIVYFDLKIHLSKIDDCYHQNFLLVKIRKDRK